MFPREGVRTCSMSFSEKLLLRFFDLITSYKVSRARVGLPETEQEQFSKPQYTTEVVSIGGYIINYIFNVQLYSGDLNTILVQYSHGWKMSNHQMAYYSNISAIIMKDKFW